MEHTTQVSANRPLAPRGHVTNASLSWNLADAKIDKAHKDYLTSEIF